jgi:hypothetical protein
MARMEIAEVRTSIPGISDIRAFDSAPSLMRANLPISLRLS